MYSVSQLIMAKATEATETLSMNSEVSGDECRQYHGVPGRTTPPVELAAGKNNKISNKMGQSQD